MPLSTLILAFLLGPVSLAAEKSPHDFPLDRCASSLKSFTSAANVRLVDRSDASDTTGRYVEGLSHVFWTTLPPDGLPKACEKHLDQLGEFTKLALGTGAGEGPLVALERLRALGNPGGGLKFDVQEPFVVDAAAIDEARAGKIEPGLLFERIYQKSGAATHYDPAARVTRVPFALKVRSPNGEFRALDMKDPVEHALALHLYKLAVEETLHEVSHAARGPELLFGSTQMQLLTPEARRFAEWLAREPAAVAAYFPALEKHYGREFEPIDMAARLAEADVTAWLDNAGLPHTETEIGGKQARPYGVRALYRSFRHDVLLR